MDIIRKPHSNQPQQPQAERSKKGNNWIAYTAVAAGIILILAGLLYVVRSNSVAQKVDHSKYQVVYLSNGQAYFGKLKNTAGEYLIIEKPYTAQSVQSDDKTKATDNTTTLLKVSAQVYGPDDSIAIKSDQVLFWQNLRSDSKVTQAIDAKQ